MARQFARSPIPALVAAIATLFALGANAGTAASSYIVTAHSAGSAAKAVRRAGGRIDFDLPIINGVSARLTRRKRPSYARAGDSSSLPMGPF